MTRAAIAVLALCLAAAPASAQRIRVDINAVQKPIPVAVQRFAAGPGSLADDFYGSLVAGLEYSSLVIHVNPQAFVEPRDTKDFESPAVPLCRSMEDPDRAAVSIADRHHIAHRRFHQAGHGACRHDRVLLRIGFMVVLDVLEIVKVIHHQRM